MDRNAQIGAPIQSHWRGTTMLTLLASGLIAGLFVFLSVVEYSPTIGAPAYTDVLGGLIRLRSPIDGWIVNRIATSEGALVQEGALLAVLENGKLRLDGNSQGMLLQRGLKDEGATINREMQVAQREAAAQYGVIDSRVAGLRIERDGLRSDLQSRLRLLASLQRQSDQFESLFAQGYVAQLQLTQKLDDVAAEASRVAGSKAALARVERDIQVAEAERQLIGTKLDGLLESRRRAIVELERKIVVEESEVERVIRAPQGGVVSAALIAPGQSVAMGQALFTITPLGQPLVLRIFVPTRAATHITPGMDLQFSLSAYPPEKFGYFDARVETVSDAPLLPADLPQISSMNELVYLAVASITVKSKLPSGQAFPIKPGLMGEVLIPAERRTAIEWLFEPFLAGLRRAGGHSREKQEKK